MADDKAKATGEQIERLAKHAALLKKEWDDNTSVNISALSHCESAVGRINRAMFSGR